MDAAAADILVRCLRDDYRSAELAAVDRAMLDYAVKLTRDPSQIESADIQVLRKAGLDDRTIHDLCAIVSYFAFANRVANGLGIELESD